jgi:hypothetical protein
MVVNTEVDYRDEDDLTQTDIGHGAGGSSNGSKGQSTVRVYRYLLSTLLISHHFLLARTKEQRVGGRSDMTIFDRVVR